MPRFIVTVATSRGVRYLAATGYTERASHAAFYSDQSQADVAVEPYPLDGGADWWWQYRQFTP